MDDLGAEGCVLEFYELIAEVLANVDKNESAKVKFLKLATTDKARRKRVRCELLGAIADTVEARQLEFITAEQLTRDTLALIQQLPPDLAGVAGVPRSGMIPASILATHLYLPLGEATRDGIRWLNTGWRAKDLPQPTQRILIVDDSAYLGSQMRKLRKVVERHNATTAVIYSTPAASVMVDHWVALLGKNHHHFAWNVFNNPFTAHVGCDFDGVVCPDCSPEIDADETRYANWLDTVAPLGHLPRRNPISLIATARLERHRAATEAWLKKWGIQFRELRMCREKFATNPERNKSFDVVDFKCQAAMQVALFIESDLNQVRAMRANGIGNAVWIGGRVP